MGLAPHARAYSAGPEVGEESEDACEDDDENCFIFIFLDHPGMGRSGLLELANFGGFFLQWSGGRGGTYGL